MVKKGQGYANTKRHNPCHVLFVYGEIPVAVFDLVIIAAAEEEDTTVAIEGMLPIVAALNEEE
ncbi:unnamed protein product [Brassica oleracea var. botrytis]|uniref:(rape) hypothetical protein n=1 Tax=Brassica napus TaxID=3708 RepID=A0A816I7N8_BRANA|nr:unnamed protein product [Brassica napus]